MTSPKPVSLVAERAVRYLRGRPGGVDSRSMARELLATETGDEGAARRVLEAAFGQDARLRYEEGCGWTLCGPGTAAAGEAEDAVAAAEAHEPPRTLVFVRGHRSDRRRPWTLDTVSVIRLRGDEVLSACGGDAVAGAAGNRLRRAVLEALDGAVPVIHDPPGGLRALEGWLEQPLDYPVSLRRVGQRRLGLPADHDLAALAARLGLGYREGDDPLEQADTLDACLRLLLRRGETLQRLQIECADGGSPIDWSRFAFNREFLRRVPRVPGTYEFYDADGKLIYVGKTKCLHDRLASYFSESGRSAPRVRKLLDALHRIEYRHAGSALEAALREAEAIARRKPRHNVQRKVEPRKGRAGRLRSILILEPAEPPNVLRAFLIRDGRLLERQAIGPRGGGLKRIRRILDDRFFSCPNGPTPADDGPDLDVELVVRWLTDNRDRVVAFDPTDLRSSDEVIERLRWFLDQGTPFDGDGAPVFTR